MSLIWSVGVSGLFIGLLMQIFIKRYMSWYSRQQAEGQAQDLLDSAQEKADELMDMAKASATEYQNEIEEKAEREFSQFEDKIQKLQSSVDRTKNQLHSRWLESKKSIDDSMQTLERQEQSAEDKLRNIKQKWEVLKQKKQTLKQSLLESHSFNESEVLEEIVSKIKNLHRTRLSETLIHEEETLKDHLEREAKKTINIVLNRFVRPYCPERGIGFIVLESENEVNKMLGPNKSHIEYLEKACGVDIIFNERAKSLSVSGFDPVRRELARATLEQLSKEKIINEKVIETTMESCKIKLFNHIKNDGLKISKELGVSDMKPEIKNMMGALRYRYSFTQNQYFHCAEVGHLCGLLASEMGESIKDAKRAGLLHDIGKAMDHSIDGGHAVIGADFIEKNGEASHIVHAVRAHHFDETPSTNLAYLVIAADAISGARPGARRSTTSTYLQKMDQLQEIGNSFEGVIDTFILSAGREVRITVDSHKVDDYKALELSKSIARKIETECNYPGTIKVTVVRESQAVEMAR